MSPTTLYLAQLISPVAIIVALALLVNADFFKKLADDLRQPLVTYIAGIAALVSCTALILAHNVWEMNAAGLITFIGWAGAIKGALLILMPESCADLARTLAQSTALFVVGGLIWLAAGGYLAYVGYFA